jgi:anti-sigma B factor antagonist
MDIQVTEHVYKAVVIAPQGRLDAASAPALRERINQLCNEGYIYFVLDLSDVSFMDSAGLTVLVSLLRRTRQTGGNVKMVRPKQEAAIRVLRLTKMDYAFVIIERSDEPLFTF